MHSAAARCLRLDSYAWYVMLQNKIKGVNIQTIHTPIRVPIFFDI